MRESLKLFAYACNIPAVDGRDVFDPGSSRAQAAAKSGPAQENS
jgi:hypothetical protein